ncbi:MAG: EamA family transporter [Candidatus Aminicenantes bacterium]|nr:EamA family transporter [Candidatus Aminicenantes bacterium]
MALSPLAAVALSAALFGISTPLAKLLLGDIHPIALAGLLYAGVFLGLGACRVAGRFMNRGSRAPGDSREAPLGRRDLPWLAGAILAGGVFAPICLMLGLSRTSGFAASLLINFEAAATALVAVFLFRESAGRRVWFALALMTAGGALLSWDPGRGRLELTGPLLVLAAMAGWGLDNNLTRQISDKDPVQIAMAKGLVAGAVALGLAFSLGRGFALGPPVAAGLAVGAVCYGLSLVLFIKALKGLGAFRTGALFSLGPFVGALASIALLGDRVGPLTAAAGLLMAGAVALVILEEHTHAHHHDRLVHSHAHVHSDLHHGHAQGDKAGEPHAHEHVHEELDHVHGHWPDTHHRH